jgi:hypothetical protein
MQRRYENTIQETVTGEYVKANQAIAAAIPPACTEIL